MTRNYANDPESDAMQRTTLWEVEKQLLGLPLNSPEFVWVFELFV